ncbi:hypothetical protein [Agrobacterium sp. LMR679]|uniref:hypothetical protein n=1 Tax=Agrobacterium sp. LMR679 TaxID=3014335 RepID=UPI0022AF6027|nr:hypothetical protein [Agrobacterium sp. LMR679]MCZ4072403.1 hypothetical protein [Agrobacterium sp. LMR679]
MLRREALHQYPSPVIQKVVIGKSPNHRSASLEVCGQIALILAAMETFTILEERMKLLHAHDFEERFRRRTGDVGTKKAPRLI